MTDTRARAAAEEIVNLRQHMHGRGQGAPKTCPSCQGLVGAIADAVEQALKERDGIIAHWMRRAVDQDEEIARLRADTSVEAVSVKAKFAIDRAVQAVVAAERQWWLDMSDETFPCIAAGRPNGSCKHEGWLECLLDAAALRAPTPPEATMSCPGNPSTCSHPRVERWTDSTGSHQWECLDCETKFAVGTQIAQVVAAERERCAKVVESHVGLRELAAALRAPSEEKEST